MYFFLSSRDFLPRPSSRDETIVFQERILLEYNDHLSISLDLVLVTPTNSTDGVQVAEKSILHTKVAADTC
jgi:hypothetical protein